MLMVKQLYLYSYAETGRYVSDSLVLRQFCRVYLNREPDDTLVETHIQTPSDSRPSPGPPTPWVL